MRTRLWKINGFWFSDHPIVQFRIYVAGQSSTPALLHHSPGTFDSNTDVVLMAMKEPLLSQRLPVPTKKDLAVTIG